MSDGGTKPKAHRTAIKTIRTFKFMTVEVLVKSANLLSPAMNTVNSGENMRCLAIERWPPNLEQIAGGESNAIMDKRNNDTLLNSSPCVPSAFLSFGYNANTT